MLLDNLINFENINSVMPNENRRQQPEQQRRNNQINGRKLIGELLEEEKHMLKERTFSIYNMLARKLFRTTLTVVGLGAHCLFDLNYLYIPLHHAKLSTETKICEDKNLLANKTLQTVKKAEKSKKQLKTIVFIAFTLLFLTFVRFYGAVCYKKKQQQQKTPNYLQMHDQATGTDSANYTSCKLSRVPPPRNSCIMQKCGRMRMNSKC
jgi:hypothetical protein